MSASIARCVAVLLGTALCTAPPVSPAAAPDDELPPRRVAHAGGVADGQPVTNSREALDHSVAEGYRLIEVDLAWTRDDQLVLLHDWGPNVQRLLEVDEPTVLSHAEFLATPSRLGLTAMDLAALGEWLEQHPDVDIVTDVKGRNVAGLTRIARRLPDLRARFVPQIHEAAQYEPVRALGFDRVILTLYGSSMSEIDVQAFAAHRELLAVTMPFEQAKGSLPRLLDLQGVFTYAHTVNDHVLWSLIEAGGTDGIYTDFLSPANEGREQRGDDFAPWAVASKETPLDATVIPYLPPPGSGFRLQLGLTNQGTTAVDLVLRAYGADPEPARVNYLSLAPGQSWTIRPHSALAQAFAPGRPCWVAIDGVTDSIDVWSHWRLVDRPPVQAVVSASASERWVWEGPIDGLRGQLVALVNPSSDPVSVTLARRDEHGERTELKLPLGPYALRHEQWTLSGAGSVRIEITGGPVVVQPLRWNATLGFMR